MDTEKNETDSKTATEDKESDQSAEKSRNTEESNNSQEKEGKQDEGQTEGLKTQEDPDSNTNTLDAKGGKPGQEGEITLDSLPEIKVLEDVESLILEEPSTVDPAVIDLLARGFVERFLPGLQKSQTTIEQIKSSQEVLHDTVQQEIAKFRDCQAVKDVEDTMVKARHYHNKLLRLRREMNNMHEKSRKLKKRALKLQQQKQSEELTRAHTREHELEKERMLTARLAPSPPSPS